MKYLIASDIHGSEFFCRKLIEAYKAERADRLILLGDILYHGPRNDLPDGYAPKKVIRMLNEMKNEIFCVRGNCDTQVDQTVLEFPVLADYALLSLGERIIYMTHGHVFNESNLPPMKKGDILLHGHTHVPKCTKHENFVCLNPGSVSIPKENSPHGYMILQNKKFEWKNLDGEVWMKFEIE